MTAKSPFGRIRRLRSGRYQARYPDGNGRDIPAPQTFATKREARQFLTTIQSDMLKGTYIDPKAGQISLSAWTQEWLDGDPSKRATTRARDHSVLRTHFLPLLGHRPLASIKPFDIRRAVDAMSANVAPATVRTNVGVLRAVFNAAFDSERIARSPVRGLKLAPAPARDRVTLAPDELLRLAGAVPDRYRALILVAGVMGLRWSEAAGLRIGSVDFLRRKLAVRETLAEVEGHLSVEATKSKSSNRTLSMPPFLCDALALHIRVHRPDAGLEDLVFVGPRGMPLRRSFAARLFKPAVEAAGLDCSLTFHGLRHVAASLMMEEGAHPGEIQHRLGHSTARLSMELYAHVSDDADRGIADRLNARFTGAMGTERAHGS